MSVHFFDPAHRHGPRQDERVSNVVPLADVGEWIEFQTHSKMLDFVRLVDGDEYQLFNYREGSAPVPIVHRDAPALGSLGEKFQMGAI
jgi:hypothetical protein